MTWPRSQRRKLSRGSFRRELKHHLWEWDLIIFAAVSTVFGFLYLKLRWDWLILRLGDAGYRGYNVSFSLGRCLTFCFAELVHFYVGYRYRDDPSAMVSRSGHGRPRLLAVVTGVFERLLITTLVGFQVPGAAGFIGGWVVTRGVGLYASSTRPSGYQRMRMFAAMLNGPVSSLFGVVGGIMVADP